MVMFSFPESKIDILNGARLVFVCNQLRFFGVFCQDYMGNSKLGRATKGRVRTSGARSAFMGACSS